MEQNNYVEIPIEKLSLEILWSLAEDYVLREGTDYGHSDHTTEDKVEQVIKSLQAGRAKLVFDSVLETHTILTPDEYRQFQARVNESSEI